jgi:hypothetical protein
MRKANPSRRRATRKSKQTPYQEREEQWEHILRTIQDAAMVLRGSDLSFRRWERGSRTPHSAMTRFEHAAPETRRVLREFITLIESAERRISWSRDRDGIRAPEAKLLLCLPKALRQQALTSCTWES